MITGNVAIKWVGGSNHTTSCHERILQSPSSIYNERSLCTNRHCAVPENIHTPPTEGFWFASPHPLGISVPRGPLMTPLPSGISTLREHLLL